MPTSPRSLVKGVACDTYTTTYKIERGREKKRKRKRKRESE